VTSKSIDLAGGGFKIENCPATAALPRFKIKDYETRTIPLPRHTSEILEDLKTYLAATYEQTLYLSLEERAF
jgi:hypothetical protein